VNLLLRRCVWTVVIIRSGICYKYPESLLILFRFVQNDFIVFREVFAITRCIYIN
jgi:hypothetical protein